MKWIIRIITLSIILLISFFISIYFSHFTDKASKDVIVIIPEKTSTDNVIKILIDNSVIHHDISFKIITLINAKNKRYLQPGEYEFKAGDNSRAVLKKILTADRVLRKITIPEGFTNFQISNLLNAEENLKGDISDLGLDGSYMPETYFYYYNTQKKVILDKMKDSMDEFLKNNIKSDDKKTVLILASIVEKEAKTDEERPIIASVYLNRIAQKMPLQADPTVIYALKNGKTDFGYILSKEDLKYDSPYNTYVYAGLPPSPICNPGKNSIKAVLNPANTDYLFFVADGTSGKHIFAKDYKSHLANIALVKSAN